MRNRKTPLIALTVLLGSGSALAQTQTGPGESPSLGNGGGLTGEGPPAGAEPSGGGAETHANVAPEPGQGEEHPPVAAASTPAQRELIQVGTPPPFAPAQRWWEMQLGVEAHFLLWRNNLNGAGSNKELLYYYIYPHVDFLRSNRVSFFAGAYQRFLADDSETGLRLDDWALRYSHYFHLPADITLDARLSATLPTSFLSQKAGMILATGAGVIFDRQFASRYGDADIELNLFGTYYFMQYTSAAGGNPNPRGRVGIGLTGEYALPIRNPNVGSFSLGVDLYAADYWYYDVGGGGTAGMMEPPASGNADYPHQLPQWVYGGEVYGRYQMPTVSGFKLELRTALANGDTTLGYTGLLHDGVSHLYLSYFQSSQIYFSLLARY